MAKQSGEVFLEGTYGNLTCYKMEGQYYVRRKSSLTSKKFWKHKSFEGSRKSCHRFGEGNELASKLYRMIGQEKREYKLFCFLKKRAIALLKEGKGIEEVEMILMDYLVEFGFVPQAAEENCEQGGGRRAPAIQFCNKGMLRIRKVQRVPKVQKVQNFAASGFSYCALEYG